MVLFATGEAAPPPTPPLFKSHRWLQRKRTSVSIYSCAKGRLCGSFCLQMGGAAPPPTPRFLKAIDGCTKRTSVRIYVCAKGSLKAIDGCKEKEQASGCMLALKEGCAGHFVCNWGRAAPPPTPRPFQRPSTPAKKRTSVGLSPPSMLALKSSIRSSPCVDPATQGPASRRRYTIHACAK